MSRQKIKETEFAKWMQLCGFETDREAGDCLHLSSHAVAALRRGQYEPRMQTLIMMRLVHDHVQVLPWPMSSREKKKGSGK